MKLPLDGSPSARSMTRCDHRSTSAPLATFNLGVDRREGQPHRQGRIAERLDEGHGFRCQLRRLAHPALITRDPPPAPPSRWPVTPCPRRRYTTHAIPRSGRRPHVHGLDRRSRTTWCAERCAWLLGAGPRRVRRRRSFGRAPNSVAPRRCHGWSPTLRPACASRRRRADHRRPPDVRRSAPRSPRPLPGHVIRSRPRRAGAARRDPISVAIRRPRCGPVDDGIHTRVVAVNRI